MSAYIPTAATVSAQSVAEIGFTPENYGFDSFEQNPQWDWATRTSQRDRTAWRTIVPRSAPPVGKDLPRLVQRMIESTWKFAEPSDGAARRSTLLIGSRGAPRTALLQRRTYSPQVRPTAQVLEVATPNAAVIAADWKVFEQIERANAVTFRGDTRCPWDVIVKCDGFHPPTSRTDRDYLEKNVYEAFASYLQRRYGRPLTKEKFLEALNKDAPMPQEQRMLVDYMMWRKITEREAVHLGRMTENECLKGYISSTRAIEVAIEFGTARLKKPGWLYVTVVHSGFVVPPRQELWGTEEAEIAQWGPIPAVRIVGFRRLTSTEPIGPIYMKRRFRMTDPKAFSEVFDVLSGKKP